MSEQAKPDLIVNADLTSAVTAAVNAEDIKAAVIAEAEKQGLVRDAQGSFIALPDADVAKIAAEKKAADEKAAADKAALGITEPKEGFKRTESIAGKDFEFEAETELELERMILNAYKVAAAIQPSTVQTVDPNQAAVDAAAAEKAESDRVAEATELELKFKRGEISAKEYIEQSGAVAEYLESQGVPLNELKASLQENRTKGFEQSWASATEDFLKSSAGQDWPGGERNRELIGLTIQKLGLVDADDKVGAMAQAYADMKKTGLIFPYEAPKAETQQTVQQPTIPPQPRVAAPPTTAVPPPPARSATPAASALFGRSSGTFGAVGTAEARVAADKVTVAKDASPVEIMEAWKEQQRAANRNLDEAFTEVFSGRR